MKIISYLKIKLKENLIKNNQKQIMGMQASTWTERIADAKRLYYMIFPRLAAISEDAWTNNEEKNYPSFVEKIRKFYQFLDMKGINYFNIFDIQSTSLLDGTYVLVCSN